MWVERYRDTKTVDDLPGKGETRAMSSKEDKMIVRGSHGKTLGMDYGKC